MSVKIGREISNFWGCAQFPVAYKKSVSNIYGENDGGTLFNQVIFQSQYTWNYFFILSFFMIHKKVKQSHNCFKDENNCLIKNIFIHSNFCHSNCQKIWNRGFWFFVQFLLSFFFKYTQKCSMMYFFSFICCTLEWPPLKTCLHLK